MTTEPENILHAGLPSRTALRVATVRAVHRLLDEPVVFDDPLALRILGPEAEAMLREDPYPHNDGLSRGLRAALVVRSRFAEDEVARAIAAGVRQCVVLGAGLDTFAFRHPHEESGLRVFEVDHPSTQAWKRACLARAGIAEPPGLAFAPVDFERATLGDGLADAGFRTDQPACFSWLGVTMYLREAAVFDTLGWIARLPAGSSVCFDYSVRSDLLNPVERVIREVVAQRAAAVGEPWLSAFDPDALRTQVLELGFREVESWTPDLLNQRYLHRRKDGLRTNGRMFCARV